MDFKAQTEGRSKSLKPYAVGTGPTLRAQKSEIKHGDNPRQRNEVNQTWQRTVQTEAAQEWVPAESQRHLPIS